MKTPLRLLALLAIVTAAAFLAPLAAINADQAARDAEAPPNIFERTVLDFTPGTAVTSSNGIVTSADIVRVGPFQIHRDMANNLRAIIRDAKASGLTLKGWGWRSHQRQHELRRINGCPNDGSWTHRAREDPTRWASSSRCRVPTARPGFSNHESGKAVDFTCNGARFHGTACWRWFIRDTCPGGQRAPLFNGRRHRAGCYGFFNLPSEPWHWSHNGK